MVKELGHGFMDLDDIIYPSSATTLQIERIVAHAYQNAALENTELQEATVDQIVDEYEIVRERVGSNANHFPDLFKRYGIDDNDTKLTSVLRTAYNRAKLGLMHPFPGVVETILSSMRQGLNWGVITNGLTDKQWDKLALLDMIDYFDPVIISEEVAQTAHYPHDKVKKPNKFIYERALKTLNEGRKSTDQLEPEQLIYIDDRLHGIMGAKRFGMYTVWIPNGKYSGDTPEMAAHRLNVDVNEVTPNYKLDRISQFTTLVLPDFTIKSRTE